jgi:tRNA(Ile2) C34 agmatinyltransferase TiaS
VNPRCPKCRLLTVWDGKHREWKCTRLGGCFRRIRLRPDEGRVSAGEGGTPGAALSRSKPGNQAGKGSDGSESH